jgi:hypothetical protein
MLFNPYGLAYTLNDFPATVYLNNKYAGTGNLRSPIQMREETYKAEGDLIFTMDNWKTVISTLPSVLSQQVKYRIKGDLKLCISEMDACRAFSYEGEFELNPFRGNTKNQVEKQ